MKTENIESNPGKLNILTHRGLDPEKQNYYTESSREAFTDQIARGFGLEFDLQFTKDGGIVILHDNSLSRLTEGKDARKISEIDSAELLIMDFKGCHLTSLDALIRMIQSNAKNRSMNAIHIKHAWQEQIYLDQILQDLENIDTERFVLFDLTVEMARYLKGKRPTLHLAPSLAHPYDIKRYNRSVGGTLLSIEEVIKNRDLYDWVWLDEWDRTDEKTSGKSLYNAGTFETLRNFGFKIALVTPELHKTSPGLLGGESHQDASSKESLHKRFEEILALHPDAICTDYPDTFKKLIAKHVS